jgi:hypothetical protein
MFERKIFARSLQMQKCVVGRIKRLGVMRSTQTDRTLRLRVVSRASRKRSFATPGRISVYDVNQAKDGGRPAKGAS